MEIKELKPKQGNVEIVAEVTEKGDVREFEKFGKSGRVCNAKIKDASGEIKLSLWNEQIDQVNVGDTVKVTNGYVSEWQGELQLTTGKFGNLEIVGAGEAKPESMKTDEGEHILTKDEATEEESLDEGGDKPSLDESATGDEKVESDVVEGEETKKPEDDIKIEEEEIQ